LKAPYLLLRIITTTNGNMTSRVHLLKRYCHRIRIVTPGLRNFVTEASLALNKETHLAIRKERRLRRLGIKADKTEK